MGMFRTKINCEIKKVKAAPFALKLISRLDRLYNVKCTSLTTLNAKSTKDNTKIK